MPQCNIPRITISAPTSGQGKTLVSMLITYAFKQRGLRVQTYKVGPDYLDASLLTWVSNRKCRNLDGFLLGVDSLVECFSAPLADADVAVIEGVMGTLDGALIEAECTSTADIAHLLKSPMILVMDASGTFTTIGALAYGIVSKASNLNILGVMLNRIYSNRHLQACERALKDVGIDLLGYIPRSQMLSLPRRHLGLVSANELPPGDEFLCTLAELTKYIDIDRISNAMYDTAFPITYEPRLFVDRGKKKIVRIGVAYDMAFHFYYPENLELLDRAGAELVYFSPLFDSELPQDLDCLIIGGGYPETYAEKIVANTDMKNSILQAVNRGLKIYAECGGAMYTGARICYQGKDYEMLGLQPASFEMGKTVKVGYRKVKPLDASFFYGIDVIPAHEFHYSSGNWPADGPFAYELIDGDKHGYEGFSNKRIMASYMHVHFGAHPDLAESFVESIRSGTV